MYRPAISAVGGENVFVSCSCSLGAIGIVEAHPARIATRTANMSNKYFPVLLIGGFMIFPFISLRREEGEEQQKSNLHATARAGPQVTGKSCLPAP